MCSEYGHRPPDHHTALNSGWSCSVRLSAVAGAAPILERMPRRDLLPEEEPPSPDDPRSDPSCGPALECSLEEAADMGAVFDSRAEQEAFERKLAEVLAGRAAA